MTSIQRVVSIGAHSLDAELMGGPLILKYARQGAHCTLIHVTQGRLEDPAATEEAKQAYLKDLLTMNQKAAEKLGADTIWLGYVSSNMPSLEDFAQRMEQYFVDEKVDLVITHWRGTSTPTTPSSPPSSGCAKKAIRSAWFTAKRLRISSASFRRPTSR